MFDKNKLTEEKVKKIAIILSIIFLIIILFRSCILPPRNSHYPHKKRQENKIVRILKMPFFYVLEYPKIIMGICNDDYGGGSEPAPVKEKQYIKF